MVPVTRLNLRALSGTHQVIEIQDILLLRCIHHFKSEEIYNMDHMHISDNEPSSALVILG